MVVYGDTDSNYVAFEEVVNSCDWKEDPKDLILQINEKRFVLLVRQNCGL